MLGFRYDMYFSVLYCYETGPIVLIKIGPVPYNQRLVPWSSVQMIFPELVFQLHLKTDEEALCPSYNFWSWPNSGVVSGIFLAQMSNTWKWNTGKNDKTRFIWHLLEIHQSEWSFMFIWHSLEIQRSEFFFTYRFIWHLTFDIWHSAWAEFYNIVGL